MKHFNVLLSGLLALGLTGFVLTHPAWVLGKKSNHLPGRHAEARAGARDLDWSTTEMGRRWHNVEPNHWRGYMLQH